MDLARTRPTHWKHDSSCLAVLLSTDPKKNIKFSANYRSAKEDDWNYGNHKVIRSDYLRDRSNGFLSDNDSITFEIYIEYPCIV